MIVTANLFEDAALQSDGERFDTLLSRQGIRIERIVSHGQSSPAGFWYDQPQDEWVVVLHGSAELEIQGENGIRRLGPGDYLLIPAHCRHRVARTEQPTIWLAVHVELQPEG